MKVKLGMVGYHNKLKRRNYTTTNDRYKNTGERSDGKTSNTMAMTLTINAEWDFNRVVQINAGVFIGSSTVKQTH